MYKTSKLVFSPRIRKSPYFNSTINYGAQAFSVYNHMYMPVSYQGTIEDYKNLLNKKNKILYICEPLELIIEIKYYNKRNESNVIRGRKS